MGFSLDDIQDDHPIQHLEGGELEDQAWKVHKQRVNHQKLCHDDDKYQVQGNRDSRKPTNATGNNKRCTIGTRYSCSSMNN